MGKFKHLRKGVKIDRTTEDVATPVQPSKDHETLQGYTLGHRSLIFEQDTLPFGKIKGCWIYPL